MIPIILMAVAIMAIGVLGTVTLELVRSHRRTITCRCGRRSTGSVIIGDPIYAERMRDTLSEDCPHCRVRRADHPIVDCRLEIDD